MSLVRGRGNKATELALMSFFRAFRITGWRRHAKLPGTPDFAFPNRRTVVFVDGCFWHVCPKHRSFPATNRVFWQRKLKRNQRRDRIVDRALREAGWTVIRIWQHELPDSPQLRRKMAPLISNTATSDSQAAKARCGRTMRRVRVGRVPGR